MMNLPQIKSNQACFILCAVMYVLFTFKMHSGSWLIDFILSNFSLSKNEIFAELKNDDLQGPMRLCLRKLCFLLSNVSHPTPGQMDLGSGFLKQKNTL